MYFRSPLRQIQFKQGRNYTCAFSSLCSAIYAFANGNDKIKQFASKIHVMRQPNHDTQLIGNLKQAIDRVTKGQFIFTKITNFQVHSQYEPGPVLGFLMDEKGATEHAVSFWGKEIFDSNLNFTLARGDSLMETKKVLSHCCFPLKFERIKLAYRFEEANKKKKKDFNSHKRHKRKHHASK
jgi:hypothetical protein